MPTLANIEVLDAAHEYRDYGFSCIPLLGKKPAIAWKQFQERHPTHGELLAWFGVVQKSRRNIGIVTGSISGIVAVDVDSHAMAQWVWNHLPRTDVMTRSGNGKGHLYYRIPNGVTIRNRVRIKGKAIDIRGEGGYCVAPPSLHPVTGQQYQKVGNWNLSAVPEFPVEWIDEEPVHISVPIRETVQRIQMQQKHITDLLAYCLPIPSIQGQNGSKGCFRVACLCRSARLSPEQAFAFLQEWQTKSPLVEPKWNDRDLLHKIDDVYSLPKERNE